MLVAFPSERALCGGAKLICSLQFPPNCVSMRVFHLSGKQFVASLSDGSLHLVTVGDVSMTALPLGSAGHGVASVVSLLSTVSFKQGACHLMFVAFASGDSSLCFLVPSNPKPRRLQPLATFLSLAPVSCIVPVPSHRRL